MAASHDAVDFVALVSLDVLICDDQGGVEVELIGLDQSRVVLLGQLAEDFTELRVTTQEGSHVDLGLETGGTLVLGEEDGVAALLRSH